MCRLPTSFFLLLKVRNSLYKPSFLFDGRILDLLASDIHRRSFCQIHIYKKFLWNTHKQQFLWKTHIQKVSVKYTYTKSFCEKHIYKKFPWNTHIRRVSVKYTYTKSFCEKHINKKWIEKHLAGLLSGSGPVSMVSRMLGKWVLVGKGSPVHDLVWLASPNRTLKSLFYFWIPCKKA